MRRRLGEGAPQLVHTLGRGLLGEGGEHGGRYRHAEEAQRRHDDEPGVVDGGNRLVADLRGEEDGHEEVELHGRQAQCSRQHEPAHFADAGVAPIGHRLPHHPDEAQGGKLDRGGEGARDNAYRQPFDAVRHERGDDYRQVVGPGRQAGKRKWWRA